MAMDPEMTEIPPAYKKSLFEAAIRSKNADSFNLEVSGVSASTRLPLPSVIEVVGPGRNTLLHAAASSAGTGSKDITNWLVQQHPRLILEKNYAGDTALHLAAKAGNTETIQVLLQHCSHLEVKSEDNTPTTVGRMKNGCGNTALHEAMILYSRDATYCDVVKKLASADPETAYIQNNKGKSPLYLAVEAGVEVEILNQLLEHPLTPGLPEGQSPVHAAIKYKRYDQMLQILNKRPELIHLTGENGRKALHYAAEMGDLRAIEYILDNFPSEINERDNEGLYPLLVACEGGYVKTYQALRSVWPDPTVFLDNNYQNILHVAAKNGRDSVVRCILKDSNLGPKLVNTEDKDGNTPLHLAAMNGHSLVVGTLLLDRNCNSQILNAEGLTPYGMAKVQADSYKESEEKKSVEEKSSDHKIADPGEEKSSDHKNADPEKGKLPDSKKQAIVISSKKSHAPDSLESRMTFAVLSVLHLLKSILDQKPQKLRNIKLEIKRGRVDRKVIEARVTGLFVVAGLVAAAAFAGALQLPGTGGDEKGDSNNNNTTSNHASARWWWSLPSSKQHVDGKQMEIYLRVYIFFDTLSLNLAIMAVIILCWVQLARESPASFFVWVASLILGFSLYTMCLAFGFALLLGLKDNASFGLVMIMVEGLFLIVMTVLISPMLIPFGYSYLLGCFVYFSIFIAYFVLKRFLGFCCCCCCQQEV